MRLPSAHRASRAARRRAALWLAPAPLALAPIAAAQNTQLSFSVDGQGPINATVGSPTGAPINDADILVSVGTPFDPDSPVIALQAAFLDVYQSCSGHLPGVACGLEINAFSFGRDARIRPTPGYTFRVYASVDEFAQGMQPPAGTALPTVFSEAQASEAAADVFASQLSGAGPFPPVPSLAVGVADGDGVRSSTSPSFLRGLGVTEPIPPTPGGVDLGDNIDGFDIGPGFDPAVDVLFFSLQGGFPLCNEPNAQIVDAAALQSVITGGPPAAAADVLLFRPGIGVGRYIRAQALGLDLLGVGTDDIDALMVVENGVPGYQPPQAPYDWIGPNASDLVLFSLRCGSQTIGQPDANFGIPITQGDILLTLGAGGPPGIFVPAEAMGLQTVSRGGTADDELDGFDIVGDAEEPWVDCNMNNVEDTIDIVLGNSLDDDSNGIPDECEDPGSAYCDCEALAAAPCGNTAGPDAGCLNAVGLGGQLVGLGTSSIETDSLHFDISNLPPLTFGLLFMGDVGPPLALGNGSRCVGTMSGQLWRVPVFQATVGGTYQEGPGLLGVLAGGPSVTIGSTYGFQAWYRDSSGLVPNGPCGQGSNLTNAWSVTFTP